jgi:hypothetical protein
MPYSFIIIIAVMALSLWYIFISDAGLASKVLVGGLLSLSLACIFWWHRFSLAALLVMVGLGVDISFYRIYARSHFSD